MSVQAKNQIDKTEIQTNALYFFLRKFSANLSTVFYDQKKKPPQLLSSALSSKERDNTSHEELEA